MGRARQLEADVRRFATSISHTGSSSQFDLPADRVGDWHAQGVLITHFLNTFSVMAPAFERFIIVSARYYQSSITDPKLKEGLAGLFAQEAMHSREHRHYNRLLSQAGLPGRELERQCYRFLDYLLGGNRVAPSFRLAVALMFEHHTALASTVTLNNPALLEGSVPGYAQLWNWHAREENEHKSAAYDLWNSVIGRGVKPYLLRIGAVVLIGPPTFLMAVTVFTILLRADHKRRVDARAVWLFLKHMYGTEGLIANTAKLWFRYFLPDFHPDM
ncbi:MULTISPECIES: metal-dependent hydrolase [Pseudomonas syringae group]|uniref:metal-dependent hydrolase n=1 Tax=Pseudomonas syringae group TaxID=136849 RepID=UPI00070C47F8|nr:MULTISPECIES: metal-dependent hydrolase [Pseudomonas syringae group]MBD8186975.1 metal-dependent hydrolase [Pseudomonas viridiflava]MBD8204625.1 metal-dependent hydrolase [Pseudomonas viridiflava]MDY0935329.1 metal-dependent hydrolase [Pseudomonas viridiflava]MDY1011779.1 metal-dependent hydrolase [Pseudomonas viridiflava]TKJ67279.1 metal-dependent hydrolase [Pseudomonas viridiflava]